MTDLERKVIKMKYDGMNYPEISKAIGGRFTPNTLKSLFQMSGRLYIPYLQYEAKENQWRETQIRERFKQKLGYLDKVFDHLMAQALKNKDYRLAFEMLKEAMDRGEFTVVRKTKIEPIEPKKIESYEQLVAELQRAGLDPDTGLRAGTSTVESDQPLRA